MRRVDLTRAILTAALLLGAGTCCGGAFAQTNYAQPPADDDATPIQSAGVRPELLKDVSLDQKLGDSIPLDLTFRDEHGQPVVLRSFFGSKPAILTMVYYKCPMLCTEVLNAVSRSAEGSSAEHGQRFQLVTVSIDPSDRPVLADAKHLFMPGLYGRPGAVTAGIFLLVTKRRFKKLAAAVGFRFVYDKASSQFAHRQRDYGVDAGWTAVALFLWDYLSCARCAAGVGGSLAGKIGSTVDEILLFCFHYDPVTGKYAVLILHVVRAAGVATVLGAGDFFFCARFCFGRERRRSPACATRTFTKQGWLNGTLIS